MVRVKSLRDHAVGGGVMPAGGEYDCAEPLAIERERTGFVEILDSKDAAKSESGPAEDKSAGKSRKTKSK